MKKMVNDIISLAKLSLQFGRVDRVTYHEDATTPESDTDHTVMLGLIACAYAKEYAPHLDRGRIAEFALVHDLVEVYAGDTMTFKHMTDEEKKDKSHREHQALLRIKEEFRESLPWVHETIEAYESLSSPEARFVKTIDKILPPITHLLNDGVVPKSQGHTRQSFAALKAIQREERIALFAHDQDAAVILMDDVVERLIKVL